MSTISIDIPTFQVNDNELQNLVRFIYKHEKILKEFGAIKIRPNIECKLALKKRRKNLMLHPAANHIVQMNFNDLIYSVQKVDEMSNRTQLMSSSMDEDTFWSSLSLFGNAQRSIDISIIPNKSFFSQKTSRIFFDIHRLPNQSLLKLGGIKVTRQIAPNVKRAHGPGAIFPLSSAQQNLFSIDYHHEGGNHHWYIIPHREREALRKIFHDKNSNVCLDHGQLLIDPSVLDKHQILYHRVIQHPNEFVVLSAGTLAQSFTEDASWSESIVFALPSWIEEAYASTLKSSCQCSTIGDFLPEPVDINLFRHELIQRYTNSYLNTITDIKSICLKGLLSNLTSILRSTLFLFRLQWYAHDS